MTVCLGIPGRVVGVAELEQLRATVDLQGVHREVSMGIVGVGGADGVEVGDWVLVHVGFALARITESEARQTLDELQSLDDLYAEQLAEPTGAPEVV